MVSLMILAKSVTDMRYASILGMHWSIVVDLLVVEVIWQKVTSYCFIYVFRSEAVVCEGVEGIEKAGHDAHHDYNRGIRLVLQPVTRPLQLASVQYSSFHLH